MKYIDAKELVELSVKNNILKTHSEHILLYREAKDEFKEGWYATPKEDVIHIIMNDKIGQDALINALKNEGIIFELKSNTLNL